MTKENDQLMKFVSRVQEEREASPMLDHLLTQRTDELQRVQSRLLQLDYGARLVEGVGSQNLVKAFADILHDALGGGPRPIVIGGASLRHVHKDAVLLLRKLAMPLKEETPDMLSDDEVEALLVNGRVRPLE